MSPTHYQNSGIPFLRISDLVRNQIILTQNSKFILKEKNSEFQSSILKTGDLVMAKVGSVGEIDKIAQIPELIQECNISQNLIGIKVLSEKVNSKYLLNYMKSKKIISQILAGTTHTSLKSLRLSVLRNLEILLPSLSVQTEIIQSIENAEEKFQSQKTQFENIKENYESKINYINHIQSSILDTAFSGKLVN